MKKVNQEAKEELKEEEQEMNEQPKKRTIKDVMIEDVNLLRGLVFTTDEVEKFGMIITKVKQDLMSCLDAIFRDEEREEQKNADTDAE